jgi:hypothetical protein
MSAFVIGIPVPEGLDARIYRVRVVVDRVDGAALTREDLAQIEAAYPSKPAKQRAKRASAPPARKAKPARKSTRAA